MKAAKAYMRTGSKTQAALAAGYSSKNPAQSGEQALRKIEPLLNRLMDREGLSERKLLQPIKEGIVATRHISGMLVGADGAIAEASHEVPDHTNRLKACELGWKLRGHLRPTSEEGTASLNVNLLLVGLQAIAQRRVQRSQAEEASPSVSA